MKKLLYIFLAYFVAVGTMIHSADLGTVQVTALKPDGSKDKFELKEINLQGETIGNLVNALNKHYIPDFIRVSALTSWVGQTYFSKNVPGSGSLSTIASEGDPPIRRVIAHFRESKGDETGYHIKGD